MRNTFVLIVLDGWGIGEENESNPVSVVKPETFARLAREYPVTSLHASGISVGLPWGETGNSEVGHLTLGAGKVLYQSYPRVTLAIRDKSFFENKTLKDLFVHAKERGTAVNAVGLLSKGNVHASVEHVLAILEMGTREGVKVKLHLFADGKDSPPRSIDTFLKEIPKKHIATLTGRYYGMDREGRWTLTQKAYETLLGQGGLVGDDPAPQLKKLYDENITEEFLPPLRLQKDGGIKDHEAVLFFNFREDSIRQIAEAFIVPEFNTFPVTHFTDLPIATMVQYKDSFAVPVLFPPERTEYTLGKLISDAGKTQLRLAETYKYAHITYFFNGHTEAPLKNEYRVLIPSIQSPHAEEHPEMQAQAITDRLIQAIESQGFDFILVNYANPDTIGHTGNYEGALEAIRTIDRELGRCIAVAEKTGTPVILTSDHGNIEELFNPRTGTPETQHDPNPVPFYLVVPEYKGRAFRNAENLREPVGTLADVAPTVLHLMGIPKPDAMTGNDLLNELML